MKLLCALHLLLAFQPEQEARYWLPWPEGKTYRCTQGNNDRRSHTGVNKYAFDFGMKTGTEVCAVRSGRVKRVKEDSNEGGPGRKYVDKANIVVIEHADGTTAIYAHLKLNGALVEVGDHVQRGQVIALSGATGAATAPHLHFMVMDTGGKPMEIRFEDVDGNGGIAQGGKSYKSGNGRLIPPETAGRLKKLTEEADLAWTLGAFSIAHRACRQIAALNVPEEVPQITAARKRIVEIEKLFEETLEADARTLLLAERAFSGPPFQRRIKSRVKELREKEGVKELEAALKPDLKAQSLLFKALEEELDGALVDADKRYKACVKAAPDSGFAALAKARRDSIKPLLKSSPTTTKKGWASKARMRR